MKEEALTTTASIDHKVISSDNNHKGTVPKNVSVQKETPLFTHLLTYAQKKTIPFHIPGHKKGAGMHPGFRHFLSKQVAEIDLINIAPLDDLHKPEGAIAHAQALAADAFKADSSFFSVQGTSGAIITMILSVCQPGDKIILPRNVHKSILSAIILSGSYPIFVSPNIDPRFGIAHGISLAQAEETMNKHPDAKAIILVHPTYYGVAGNIKEITKCAHKKGILVLVDEAHGAHIHFHPDLPCSSMEANVDMAATSLHKLGGSLTQSSLLNIRHKRINHYKVQTTMSMLTTTSTSYILMASLDCARQHLALKGTSLLAKALKLARQARIMIQQIDGLCCMDKSSLDGQAAFELDETKLLVNLHKLTITGIEAERWLRQNHKIEVEMSDRDNLLFIITWADTKTTIAALVTSLKDLAEKFIAKSKEKLIKHIPIPKIPKLMISPREAFYKHAHSIPLSEAEGHIIAETITIYPPGIPVLLPGEVINRDSIEYITTHIKERYPVQGMQDPDLKKIKVIAN